MSKSLSLNYSKKSVLLSSSFVFLITSFNQITHAGIYPNLASVPPTTKPATLTTSKPLVLTTQSNKVINGVKITNPNGDCIVVQGGSQNIQIANSVIGPCSGDGIKVISSKNVIIKNVTLVDAKGISISINKSDDLTIVGNNITAGTTSVYAVDSTRLRVEQNKFKNAQGPMPRGAFVQFNRVNGGGNRIACNTGQNIAGQSNPEDAVNLYQSNGLSYDPIRVSSNRIQGGGPSASGGGIILGDGGGSYQTAQDNRLYNCGQYGISIAGGHHQQLLSNQILSQKTAVSNVGLYVWNQYPYSCYSITASGNRVYWLNKSGTLNSAWDGKNCGTISGWSNNDFRASNLSATTLMGEVPTACANGVLTQ